MQIKTTMRYHFKHVRMAVIKKTRDECWRGYGEKGTLEHSWWECKLVQPLWKTVWKSLKKLAVGLLGKYPKEIESISEKDICTPMFIAALFTIAKKWKQPGYLVTDEWIKKM